MDLYLIFQFVKRRCHGNQIIFHNEGKLILRALLARLADGSTVLFRYYLLGGDIAAPYGLYARLSRPQTDDEMKLSKFSSNLSTRLAHNTLGREKTK